MTEAIIPITGPRLTLPEGPIFNLHRAARTDYEVGAFRPWAGYKDLGTEAATGDLAHLQHVLSFAPSEVTGRTGIHGHFAHVHLVIPTSGRGVFSYDGVVTEAAPGSMIVQHGGTIHDQFQYSYAADSDADNRKTPLAIEPEPAGAPRRSFAFLELFVPGKVADVEIVPPAQVTEADQRTAWDHPYHAEGARFCVQPADAPDAVYRPVAGRPDLEARDTDTWAPTGGLVATWFIRPASETAPGAAPISLDVPGETGGIDILYMVSGQAKLLRKDGVEVTLREGDCLTCDHGAVGEPFGCSPDMRLIAFFIAAKAQTLRKRTPDEIERLEALGPRIITRREVRPDGDTRPVNVLHEAQAAVAAE